jgi:DNA-binding MarR family transcriptional regulator
MTTEDPRVVAAQALEAEFTALMTQAQRLIMETAARVSPGMLPGDYKVFTAIVRNGSITATALAECLHMDKGQISRTVRGLLEHGLIIREPDPADARVSVLSASPEGLAKLDAARHPHPHSLIDALEQWDVADIEMLTRLLHALSSATPPTHD